MGFFGGDPRLHLYHAKALAQFFVTRQGTDARFYRARIGAFFYLWLNSANPINWPLVLGTKTPISFGESQRRKKDIVWGVARILHNFHPGPTNP